MQASGWAITGYLVVLATLAGMYGWSVAAGLIVPTACVYILTYLGVLYAKDWLEDRRH